MANREQPSLASLYSELNKFAQNQEYGKALKVANRIFHEAPKEESAFQCKVVCLIRLDRFEDALIQIHKNKEMAGCVKFEKGYCEYRLNRTQDALATLRTMETLDNRCKELLAQVLYRLEQYQECYDLYREVIKNSEDDYDEERETNLSAVIASLQLWNGKDVENPGFEENSYELCYNMACHLIGKDDLKKAEQKLKRAEVLCQKSFEDDPDVTEDEVEDELAIIRVQLAYVLQKQGKVEQATQIYNQVLKNKPSDVGLSAVASNNIVTLNKDQNVFDSKKKMKVATGDNLKQKLTSKQRKYIQVNQCLVHMYSSQGEQCHQLAAQLKEQYPDLDTPILIEAAQFTKEKDLDRASKLLQDYAEGHPEKALSTKLVVAQLCLAQKKVYKACDVLKSLGDLQYKPGVVSALVTLYFSQEDREAASDVLVQAVKWYTKQQPKSPFLPILMRANADFQLKNGNPQVAASMLEELRKQDKHDSRVLAKLIAAYSQFDPEKAKLISKSLPSVEQIAQDIDVDQLESSFSTLGPKYMKKKTETVPSPGPSGDMVVMKTKKKRKGKKGKLPKNMDAEIDPERWLPRRERSYYRGRRKDKRKEIGKGSQGATTASTDLDASKSAGGSGSEASSPRPGTTQPSSPSPSTTAAAPAPKAQGPRQQKPGGAAAKKKKKKGGKW